MRPLLAAINAKYIHSNLAVRSISAYAKKHGLCCPFAEFTINMPIEQICADILRRGADMLLFSCYIWNIGTVLDCAATIKAARPDTLIALGGPEVSYDSEELLEKYPFIDLIFRGEGEESVYRFLKSGGDPQRTPGVTARINGDIFQTAPPAPLDMDSLPFCYSEEEMEDLHQRLVYYESSRGCPFSCAYCLSAADTGLRTRSLELVFAELSFFVRHGVRTVKFVDRTFNADRARTLALLRFIAENGGDTCFHLEIAAAVLTAEAIDIINSSPKNFRLEIGVQSTNEETLLSVNRRPDIGEVRRVMGRLLPSVHTHLDLIAGLPYEGLERFARSFDEVAALRPSELQLGFLKLLKGTPMRDIPGYRFRPSPPYTVLANEWLSVEDILELEDTEEAVELFYNRSGFERSLSYILEREKSAFGFFRRLGAFLRERGLYERPPARRELYGILAEFYRGGTLFLEYLRYDYFTSGIGKREPEWAAAEVPRKPIDRFSPEVQSMVREKFPQFSGLIYKEVLKRVRFLWFCRDVEGDGGEREVLVALPQPGAHRE